jgi:hypothetical protein
MSWLDMLTMTVAAVAALECITGRLAALHWREHRPGLLLGYFAASAVCILAASMTWQAMDVRCWLDAAAWVIAAHLALTWGDWRTGPPLTAYRAPPQRYRPGDLAPSSQFDDGRR